ncbi:MAG: DUF115 domain-containing protein [Saccharospirillaceae bacterium]|nr:hypothetical protein A3759_02650 [Thalassolituus sp. HI0120]MCH2040760.1 DUF115 domain-containing protein [Saccharospirillaceae bacterium]
MQSPQEVLASLQARKEKNLSFFARNFPGIHEKVKERKLQRTQVNIDPKSLEVNLMKEGIAIYPEAVAGFNHKEARQFSDAFPVGGMNHPLRHTFDTELHQGRFFHGTLARFLRTVGAVQGNERPYRFEHSIPQVAFLGCGLGQHISEFLKIRDVRHIVVAEHDMDVFAASLYVTDWEDLITPYIQDQTKSFVLSIGDTIELEDHIRVHTGFAAVWNNICMNIPFMPIQTVFYVHQGDAFYTRVANRLNEEIEPYINIWGFYDDEINQLNHLIHNINQRVPVMRSIDLSSSPRATLVCGNGPSLDHYIETIKKYRARLTVIAAGSAGHSLMKNGIKPDFLVSLESDAAMYDDLALIPEVETIPIIGAAQIRPETYNLFSDGIMYLKQETTYAKVFESKYDTVMDGTPSATNAALAVAIDLKLPNIFFVGLDYGFQDKMQTHSQSSFYLDEDTSGQFEDWRKNLADGAYFLEENEHGKIYTTPFYNTSRTHAQRKLLSGKRFDIHNLSQGATIENCPFMKKDDFIKLLENLTDSDYDVFQLVKNAASPISHAEKNTGIKIIRKAIVAISEELLEYTNQLQPNLESIEVFCFKANQSVINNKNPDVALVSMMVRGTIWFWLFNLYALAKHFDAEKDLPDIVKTFTEYFSSFLRDLPKHYDSYLSDTKNPDDIKLTLQISENEPDIEKWLKKYDKEEA